MSRRVIANVVMTIDGRTTGPAGAGDMSAIAPHGVSDEARERLVGMTQATTALLGRVNYQGFAGWWPHVATMADADPRDRAFAKWLNSVEKIVFSTSLSAADWSNARIVDADPADLVSELKQEPGGDIRVLSSASIIRQLLAADLVDRLELTLSPEIVGAGGEQLFDSSAALRSSWEIVQQTRTGSGAAILVLDRVPAAGRGVATGEEAEGTTVIENLPERRVLRMRETVPIERLTEFQGRALAAIWAALKADGRTSPEHPYMRCHHETDTTMDVEVGLPLDEPGDLEERSDPLSAGTLPGGPALVHTHYGNHATLGEAYAAVSAADTAGLVRVGPPWEVYEWCDFLTEPNPATWPQPDNWTTLLVQPLDQGGFPDA
ncbi:dihydrofolate reductase family protein [Nonomuraea sp. NPDC004580]|uniref:dihydrofolate reductase family protein n=1 Tax=Nonomuraea sp. NPDC004580 TaxID=3154552 RepID=UPI0033A03D68